MSCLYQIALVWAAKGQPVFPLYPRRKEPHGQLVPHGKDEATSDPEQIRAWWTSCPTANVGVRCDGQIILDVDGAEGEASFAALRDTFGLSSTLTFPTPRGRRLAYALPSGSKIGNGTSRIGKPRGIDIRAGARGYIVAPGSVHPSGQVYPPDNGAPIAPLPAALVGILEPPPPRPPAPSRSFAGHGDGTTYGIAALEAEMRDLAATPQGGRHDRLYLAACRLGELEAGGELRPGVAEVALLDVLHGFSKPCGIEGGEKTIEDGLEKGSQSPRRAPVLPLRRVLRLGQAGSLEGTRR